MAEIAAGAVVAEQVVSTGLEAGAAAAVARPTQLVKASLSRVGTSSGEDSSLALARSHHTATVIGNKAYIFGGEQSGGQLCNTDVHALALPSGTKPAAEYACYPAFPLKEAATGATLVPSPRAGHAACARGKYVVIHGGRGADGGAVAEESCLWLWDSETLSWGKSPAGGNAPGPRFGHDIFFNEQLDVLILHGGRTSSDSSQPQTGGTWLYDFSNFSWIELPSAPAPPSSAAFVSGTLFSISWDSKIGGSVNSLKIDTSAKDHGGNGTLSWDTVEFPANPLAPGPGSRVGSALIPVSTGYGRYYLVSLFGGKDDVDITATTEAAGVEKRPFYSDIWSLQVPSHGFNPAAVKDAIRNTLPRTDSGAFSWTELEIVPSEQVEHEGKVHPGPRGFFAASSCAGGKSVFIWGGVNAAGEKESDGWILNVS